MAEETIILFIDEEGVGQEFVVNGNLVNQQLQGDGGEIVLQLDGQNFVEGGYVCEAPSQVEVLSNGVEVDALKMSGVTPVNMEPEEEEPDGLLKGRRISTLGNIRPTKYLPIGDEADDNKDGLIVDSKTFETSEISNCIKEEESVPCELRETQNSGSVSKKHISILGFGKDFLSKKDMPSDKFSSVGDSAGEGNEKSKSLDLEESISHELGSEANASTVADKQLSPLKSEPGDLKDVLDTSASAFDPNFPFKCPFCSKAFKLDITLELHKLSHSDAYVSSLDSKSKGRAANGAKYYQCPVCDFQCPLKRKLKLHATEKHNLGYIFTCHKCKFSGLSSKEYSDHLQSPEHGENDSKFKMRNKAMSRPFLCSQCGFRTTDKHLLERHMLTHIDKKEYPCPFCSYRGKTDHYLKKHMRTHSQEKKYECTMCAYSSNDPYGLTRHVKNMHAKRDSRYKCRECDSSFAEMCELRVHAMLEHGSADTLFCRRCTYSCKDKGEYKKHLEIHNGENIYMCDSCDFTCRAMPLLKRHLLRHSNARTHKCPKCSLSFHESGDLKRHMKNHSSEKPFRCNLCEYTCKFRNTLTLHMKVHSNVKGYSCSQCDYSTKYPCNLRKHMVVHEVVKPFLCQFCSYKASLKASLKRHVLRVHKYTGSV
ncbi:zinc finger protein 431 [Aplysia californica]|uniref:Zinc finger protein 431 n=1 Tax=Aplysia californica TaxID=6500 RepID=A0ABM0JWA8_APLCA|nr:zinc finger protein 431 [Aplysia californica]